MTSKFIIYGLEDPETKNIRYVGRSSSGLKRPSWHYQASFKKNINGYWKYDFAVNRWIRKLKEEKNLKPQIKILEEVNEQNLLDEREVFWIANLKFDGAILLNSTSGGKTNPMTEETRKKISLSLKGRKKPLRSLEHTEKIAEKLRGRPSPHRGRIVSEEFRKKMSSITRGRFKGKNHPMFGKTKELSPMFNRFAADHPASKSVICLNDGNIFPSVRSAAKFYNLDLNVVSRSCRNIIVKTRSGFIFKFHG